MPTLSALLVLPVALATPADHAGDTVLAALADDRPAVAARLLRDRLSTATEPTERADLACLLGTTLARTGDLSGAIEAWRSVSDTAACSPGASFRVADALAAQGDPHGAAARYAETGLARLLPGRDDRTYARVRGLIDATAAQTADPADPRIGRLHALALELSLSPSVRLEAAEAAGQWALDHADHADPSLRSGAATALVDLWSAGDVPAEQVDRIRLLAARTTGGLTGLALLAQGAADTPEALHARAEILLEHDGLAGTLALEAAVAARPDDTALRARYARVTAQQGLLGHSRAAWLELVGTDQAEEALRSLSDLALQAHPEARASLEARRGHLEAWLERFPTDPRRQGMERRLAATRRDLARLLVEEGAARAAVDVYDRLLREAPDADSDGVLAWEAAEAARRAGDAAEAVARWERMLATGVAPQRALASLFDHRAQTDATAAMGWLTRMARTEGPARAAAQAELARRAAPSIVLKSGADRGETHTARPPRPEVTATVRNLDDLTLRIHRVDAEAFFRAGGDTEALASLDVGVIAPDSEWSVPLPEAPPGVDQAVDLPLDLPGAGLYAVTVDARTHQAQVVVRHGTGTVLARASGGHLAVGVLDAGRPEPRARVLVRVGGRVLEGRTERDGIARFELPQGGTAHVLALGRGGPSLTQLEADAVPEPADITWSAEADRPFVLPGEDVSVRLQGRDGAAAAQGEVRVRLAIDGVPGPATPVRLTRWGTATAVLPVPRLADDHRAHQVRVEVLPIDADTVQGVLSLPVVRAAPSLSRRLQATRTEAGGLVVRVEDAAGGSVAGQPVELRDPLGEVTHPTTDAQGRLEVSPSLFGAEGRWQVRLPGRPWQVVGPIHASAPLTLTPTLDPSGRARVTLEGPPGELTLEWAPRAAEREPPAPLPGPLDRPEPALDGPETWWSTAHSGTSGEPTRGTPTSGGGRRIVQVPESGVVSVDLPDLASGEWVLRAVPADPRVHSVRRDLDTTLQPRFVATRAPLVGDPVVLQAQSLSLVTVETADGVVAAWSSSSAGAPTLPARRQVRTSWIDAEGAHGDAVHTLDTDLDVTLTAEPVGDRWQVQVTVRGPDGAPVAAEVALSALDTRLLDGLDALGIADGWTPLSTGGGPLPTGTGAWGGPLSDQRLDRPISGALLAEAAREQAAERARRAASGQLEGGASELLMGELALESDGVMGLGTKGYGSGGSGYGRGSGGHGKMGRKSRSGGRPELGPGHTHPGVWIIQETDARGTLSLDLPAPPPADWTLRAHAVTAGSAGSARAAVQSPVRPRIVAPPKTPSLPGETLTLAARVVNPADTAWSGVLDGVPVTVPAGASATVALPPLTAGSSRELVLTDPDGRAVDHARLDLPLAAPAEPAADGHLVRVSVDPGGRAPLLQWLREETAVAAPTAGTIARAGWLALAIQPGLPPADRTFAQSTALVQLQHLRLAPAPDTALDAAAAVVFLATIAPSTQAARPRDRVVPAVSATEIDAALAHLDGLVRSSQDRVAAQWARSVADRPVDRTTLARLLRDADRLDPETRALLADTTRRLGDPGTAAGLVDGTGPIAVAVRAELQLPAEARSPGLPPPGHPSRVFGVMPWVPDAPPKATDGLARVRIDGAERGTLALSTGGTLTLAVAPTAKVEVEGAPHAAVERGRPPSAEGAARSAVRPGLVGVGRVSARPSVGPTAECGTEASPCTLQLGDALYVPGLRPLPGAHCGPGLECAPDTVVATRSGRSVVVGYSAVDADGETQPVRLWVDVQPDGSARPPLARASALAFAQLHDSVGLDPLPWLAPWPHFDDWTDAQRAQAMRLRWSHRRPDDPTTLVAAFENLRDADPSASLTLEEVGTVAQAYAGAGDPVRSLEVWRAGLGAAFLAEAAPLRRLEPILGPLPSLKALVELPQAYPDLELVRRARFHLPEKLAAVADRPLPPDLVEQGVTPTDIRLLAAAWDRRFLAFHPTDPLAAEASFHLAKGLLDLGAFAAAAEQAAAGARRFPDSPVLDALVATDALARTALGETRSARAQFERLAHATDWPQEDGTLGPAAMAADARLALARLDEAGGDYTAAREAYAAVAGQSPEAAHARDALDRVSITLPQVVVLAPGEPATLTAVATHVGTADLRAYRLDLRTAFLRDGGLHGVHALQVDGVSPEWSGRRTLDVGPFQEARDLTVPLRGSGAWLVQVDVPGARATALVVRSSLSVDVFDGPAGRRVAVRRGGRPAAQVEVRALTRSGATATRTDVRGVSHVPAGAPVLVFDGAEVAFSPPAPVPPHRRPAAAPSPSEDSLDKRARRQREKNAVQFDEVYRSQEADALDASMF